MCHQNKLSSSGPSYSRTVLHSDIFAHLVEDNLFRIIDGALPRLKNITFFGDLIDLERILRLQNIDSVDWSVGQDPTFSGRRLRSALLVNGKKMKFFRTSIYNPYEEDATEFESPVFKAIAESCPNLEHLQLEYWKNESAPTSKPLLELPLGQLLPRLRFLEMNFSNCDELDAYKLFERMPSLIGFCGDVSDSIDDNSLVLERRGRKIMDTIQDIELKPATPQPD